MRQVSSSRQVYPSAGGFDMAPAFPSCLQWSKRLMSLDGNWFLWELLVAIKSQTQRWLGRPSVPQPWWHEVMDSVWQPPPFVRAEPGVGDTHLPQVSPFCSTFALSWVTPESYKCQVSLEPSLNCNTCIFARQGLAVTFLEILMKLWGAGECYLPCTAQGSGVPLLTFPTNTTGTRATNSYWNVY